MREEEGEEVGIGDGVEGGGEHRGEVGQGGGAEQEGLQGGGGPDQVWRRHRIKRDNESVTGRKKRNVNFEEELCETSNCHQQQMLSVQKYFISFQPRGADII